MCPKAGALSFRLYYVNVYLSFTQMRYRWLWQNFFNNKNFLTNYLYRYSLSEKVTLSFVHV